MRSSLPFMLDVVLLLLFFAVVLTQMVIPLWQGRKLFPVLYRDRRALTAKITETQERLDRAAIAAEIERAEGVVRSAESRSPRRASSPPPKRTKNDRQRK